MLGKLASQLARTKPETTAAAVQSSPANHSAIKERMHRRKRGGIRTVLTVDSDHSRSNSEAEDNADAVSIADTPLLVRNRSEPLIAPAVTFDDDDHTDCEQQEEDHSEQSVSTENSTTQPDMLPPPEASAWAMFGEGPAMMPESDVQELLETSLLSDVNDESNNDEEVEAVGSPSRFWWGGKTPQRKKEAKNTSLSPVQRLLRDCLPDDPDPQPEQSERETEESIIPTLHGQVTRQDIDRVTLDTFRSNSTHLALNESNIYLERIAELEQSLQRAEAELSGNRAAPEGLDIETLWKRNETLVKEVRFAEQTCVEVSTQKESLEKNVDRLNLELSESKDEVNDLREQIRELQSTQNLRQLMAEEQDQDYLDAKKELTGLKEANASLLEDLERAQLSEQDLQRQLSEQEEGFRERQEQQQQESADALSTLRRELQDLREAQDDTEQDVVIANLQQSLEEANRKVADHEKAVQNRQEEQKLLQNRLDQSQEEHFQLLEKHQSLHEEMAHMESHKDDLTEQVNDADNRYSELYGQLDACQKELQAKEDLMDTWENEIRRMADEKNTALEEYSASVLRMAELEDQTTAAQNALQELKLQTDQMVNDLVDQLDAARGEIAALEKMKIVKENEFKDAVQHVGKIFDRSVDEFEEHITTRVDEVATRISVVSDKVAFVRDSIEFDDTREASLNDTQSSPCVDSPSRSMVSSDLSRTARSVDRLGDVNFPEGEEAMSPDYELMEEARGAIDFLPTSREGEGEALSPQARSETMSSIAGLSHLFSLSPEESDTGSQPNVRPRGKTLQNSHQVDALMDAQSSLQSELVTSQTRVNELSAELSDITAKLTNAVSEKEKLQWSQDLLKSENERLQNHIEESERSDDTTTHANLSQVEDVEPAKHDESPSDSPQTNMLEDMLTDLEARLSEQVESATSLEDELKSSKQQMQELRECLAEKEAEFELKVDEIDQLKASRETLEKALINTQSEVADLSTKATSLEKELMRSKIASENALSRSDAENAQFSNLLAEKATEVQELTTSLDQALAEAEEQRHSLSSLVESRTALNEKLHHASSQLDQAHSDTRLAQQHVKRAQEDNQRLESECEVARAKIVNLEASLESRATEQSNLLASKVEESRKLQERMSLVEQECEELKSKAERFKLENAEHNKELAKYVSLYETSEASQQSMESARQAAEDMLTSTEDRLAQVNADLLSLRESNAQAQESLEKQTRMCQQERARAEELSRRLESGKENGYKLTLELQDRIASLTANLEAREATIVQLEEQVRQRDAVVEGRQQQLEQLRLDWESAMQARDTLEEQARAIVSQRDLWESKYGRLKEYFVKAARKCDEWEQYYDRNGELVTRLHSSNRAMRSKVKALLAERSDWKYVQENHVAQLEQELDGLEQELLQVEGRPAKLVH